MKKYITVDAEIIKLISADVITASSSDTGDESFGNKDDHYESELDPHN